MLSETHLSTYAHARNRRRRLALISGGLLLTAAAVGSCGFDYATDRVYTPANGANSNDADRDVAVLGAVIVSREAGAGTFVATLSNKSTDTPVTLASLAGEESDGGVTAAEVTPVEVPPGASVSLADEGGVKVTGEFAAGEFVPVVVGFDDGEQISMELPVVADTGSYAGLDRPAPPSTPAASESPGPEATAPESPGPEPAASQSAGPETE